MLHLMNTSALLLSLTITEDASLVVCLYNHILRVLLKMTKLKPLTVGFHLLKDGKDIPLSMATLPFKILNTLTMTVTVIAQLNSPPNLKILMMITVMNQAPWTGQNPTTQPHSMLMMMTAPYTSMLMMILMTMDLSTLT